MRSSPDVVQEQQLPVAVLSQHPSKNIARQPNQLMPIRAQSDLSDSRHVQSVRRYCLLLHTSTATASPT